MQQAGMEHLAEALQALGIAAEVSLSGRWARIQREQCLLYIVEALSGTRYYTWCDHPQERAVQVYPEPRQAIRAGLRRCAAIAGTQPQQP
jgi:hypothetical protein